MAHGGTSVHQLQDHSSVLDLHTLSVKILLVSVLKSIMSVTCVHIVICTSDCRAYTGTFVFLENSINVGISYFEYKIPQNNIF